jgi:hypothetical protein
MKVGDDYYRVETYYPNGNTKTLFYLKNGELRDTLALYKSNKEISMLWTSGQELGDEKLRYTETLDSAIKVRSTESLQRGFNDYMHFVCLNYRDLFEKGEYDVWFQILFWVDEKGKVPHAVCIRNNRVPPDAVISMVEDMENWHFEVEKGTKTVFIYQKVNVHVMDHNDYKL